MVTYISEYTNLYTLKSRTAWYVNYQTKTIIM